MKNKFKVGDKVKGRFGKGYIAEIKCNQYLVVHDKEYIGLHDGNTDKKYPSKRCWWYLEDSIELATFTKDDLQTGDVVTLRNGDKLFIDADMGFRDMNMSNSNNCLADLNDISNDLRYKHNDEDNDIIKVERPTYTTVFEREENEVKEMTLKEICDALGYEVKVIKEGE